MSGTLLQRGVLATFLATLFLLAGCAAVPQPPPPPTPAAKPAAPPAAKSLERSSPAINLGKIVTVWYATNRQPNNPFATLDPYGHERDDKLNFGSCEVLIPASHKRGSMGSWLSALTGKDEPVRFMGASRPMQEGAYWGAVRSILATIEPSDRNVLVFIHGYKNDFVDAARRTAQLWADLEIRGVPLFFSWPSRNAVLRYAADEAAVEASEVYLAAFLTAVSNQINAAKVHVIAHSMGNRALLRVVNRAVATATRRSNKPFAQIFLAAPDVDLDVFNQFARVYPTISARTTLYVSEKDRAVAASEGNLVHDYPRVGTPPPLARVSRIDTVEIRAPRGLTDLGHSYFAEHGLVLNDMRSLILTNKPLAQRKWNPSGHWVLE